MKQTLHDPIIASVSPTFTMSLMVICTYFVSYESIAPIVKFIWLCAVIFQVILVFYFNYHHVIKADLSIEAIYPSWFIILRWIWGHHCNCRELLPAYWKKFSFGFH